VPSQTGKGHRYALQMGDRPRCTCVYHEAHGTTCKHIVAVQYILQFEQHSDGSETVTDIITVSETIPRRTYRQNWPGYNAAQTQEKERLTDLECPIFCAVG